MLNKICVCGEHNFVLFNTKRKNKFLASTLRYYPNTDASFNVERNPGPANSSNHETTRTVREQNISSHLTCFYQNVRSLKSNGKNSCFQDTVLANQFDIIALTETWLNSSISNYEILPLGYKIFRKDRETGRRGGGVLLAVKDSLSTEPFQFKCGTLEIASVVIKSTSKNILVSVCYRPPNAGSEFLQNLCIL